MSLTLTREELVSLTDYHQPRKMVQWLRDRGWVFEPPTRPGSIPKVDRAYYLNKMSGALNAPMREKPNLDIFK